MENKKSNVAKIIFRVIGILLSIVLIPGLIFFIPAGGVAMGISSSVSQERLEQMVDEMKLSEHVMEFVEKEVENGIKVDELNSDYLQNLVLDSITIDWVDDVLKEVLGAVYSGNKPNVSIDAVAKSLSTEFETLTKNGFRDLYSAWVNGTTSQYFSTEFVQSFWENVENEILAEYTEFDVTSLGALEEKYDEYYGAGAFSDLLDEKMESFEDTWEEEFSAEIAEEVDELTAEVEQEINDAIYEAVQDSDVRMVFDSLQEVNEKNNTLRLLVYGVVFVAVLLLVSCFWFGTAGFVVSAIPLILGGILCKFVSGVEKFLLTYVDEILAAEPEIAEFGTVVGDVLRGLLNPIFGAVSMFGTITISFGVLLIGLAILVGVLKKKRTVTE
ncbi:MAG: hypothetical protein IKB07_00140 [Lachnospiraceae bacterium]|nr:hypothetical protein [Lachnospiraceae bacterium]